MVGKFIWHQREIIIVAKNLLTEHRFDTSNHSPKKITREKNYAKLKRDQDFSSLCAYDSSIINDEELVLLYDINTAKSAHLGSLLELRGLLNFEHVRR